MGEEFVRVRGVRVHYLEAGRDGAADLLLIHGLGGSIESWSEVFDRLAEMFHVIAVDLPGYGSSDKPDAPYTMEYFGGVLRSFIDALGLDRVILVGHSMGGAVAIKAYSRCEGRIGGLILIDCAGVSGAAAEVIRRYMGDGWTLESLRRLYLERIIGRLGELDEEKLRRTWIERRGSPSLNAYLRALESLSKPIPEEEIRGIRAPTLILWGSDDGLTPLEDGVRLNRLIAGSRLVVIEGAGHSPHSEAPDRVVSEIANFVFGVLGYGYTEDHREDSSEREGGRSRPESR